MCFGSGQPAREYTCQSSPTTRSHMISSYKRNVGKKNGFHFRAKVVKNVCFFYCALSHWKLNTDAKLTLKVRDTNDTLSPIQVPT